MRSSRTKKNNNDKAKHEEKLLHWVKCGSKEYEQGKILKLKEAWTLPKIITN